MGLWLRTLMEATFDGPIYVEGFDNGPGDYNGPTCFEEAVVRMHNEGGMSRERRMQVYDLMRCKARDRCNVTRRERKSDRGLPVDIGMTLFMRTGPRSFWNRSAVIEIFRRECARVELMSVTDILVSPHGGQSTNMFLKDRNSSVMEFFSKGWLKLAGVGQYVYHSIASWSGMRHRGAWRDPRLGPDEHCLYPEDDARCMSVYKNAKIGHNRTYFGEWAKAVLDGVKNWKMELKASKKSQPSRPQGCSCTHKL
ncbi:hypothetical protein Nepgr_004866 [Nepenthes gracilis]|uniref:Uncharacterized protein n=1 Tax=Nepenthes gracilis TaxID=150966 RepID=A0AAD3XFV1_NEPGR|nr:hypothetical protein Nepgr_004866 [Nepenthes gracilis]